MDSEMPCHHLFVYGSLRAEHLHPMAKVVAERSKSLGSAKMQGRLYDTGPYPAAKRAPQGDDTSWLIGRVFELAPNSSLMVRLDAYEGFEAKSPKGCLFVREKAIAILEESGEKMECWVYLFSGKVTGFEPIPDGDYLAWRERQGKTSLPTPAP